MKRKTAIIAGIFFVVFSGGAMLLVHSHAEQRATLLAEIKAKAKDQDKRGQQSPPPIRITRRKTARATAVLDMRHVIAHAASIRHFDPKDLEKLDFSNPPQSGKTAQYAVFSPQGPFTAAPIPQGVLWTLHRRIDRDGTTRDTLYAVQRSLDPEACKSDDIDIVEFAGRPLLTPHTLGPVLEDPRFQDIGDQACIHDANNEWYLFTNITTRRRTPGDQVWQLDGD